MSGVATSDWPGGGVSSIASVVQRIDPRLRIIMAGLFALLTVSLTTPEALLAAVAAAVILALLARLPWQSTLLRLGSLDGFMLVILLVLPFTVPGRSVFAIGSVTASAEGVWQAIEIVLTANAIVLACLALVGTIEPAVLGHALGRLRVPTKIVQLLLFTVRYIAVLHQEYARLRLAMKTRAFRARGTMHTWRSFGWLFGMLLVRSFERAERILEAMKCRGFAGQYHLIDACRIEPRDRRFAFFVGLAFIGISWIEWQA